MKRSKHCKILIGHNISEVLKAKMYLILLNCRKRAPSKQPLENGKKSRGLKRK